MLTLDKIARFYGTRLIFKDVSLTLRPGSVTLLAGPNGAGKSTLLKIIAGLISPSAGKIIRQEEDVAIGFLGHQTFIYPALSARENLYFWCRLHGFFLSNTALDKALERVELAPFAEEKAGGFSRGMAQRLNLARVFLLNPGLLLLDEPGTGLDTRSTGILQREISKAREQGTAIVWISHSLHADLPQADDLALLENKKLAYYGPAREYTPASSPGTVC